MQRELWAQSQELFHQAAELPPADRPAFLREACGGNAAMAEEILAMLAADQSGESLLDRGLPQIAYEMVGDFHDRPPSPEFGPYRLLRILGEGGMGVVWLAERADVGTHVAIKFLPHAGLSPSRRERFLHETRTLARLTHPYIARLYDAGALPDGTPWFVMEYVQGVPLTEYCRAPSAAGPRSIDEVLRLFRRVCEAVQYAHSQTILHRDLKPSNILVEPDGTPRLLDFGIARELQQEEGGEQTRAGLRFLSPHYAAPEWVRDGILGLPTDVYSLGVILYEILTGRLPFAAADAEESPEKPSEAARSLAAAAGTSAISGVSRSAWRELDLLCRKAMHPEYSQRYPTVEALIRDLDHFLKGEPLEARPPTLGYRVSKFVRRNRRAVLAASFTLLLVAGLTVAFTIRLARARDAALAESARRERIQRFMSEMLGAADPEAGPANDLRVVTLLDHGVTEADALRADPESQGDLYENLGNMYDKLGDYPKAEHLLALALDRRREALKPDDPRIAEAMANLGMIEADESRFSEAEQSVNAALGLLLRTLPPDAPEVIAAKGGLGRVVAEAQDSHRAIAIVEPLVPILTQRHPLSNDEEYALSEILTTLTVAQYSVGNIDKSDEAGKRALELDRQLFGKAHPQVAFDLVNLGENQSAMGRNQEAEEDYRQASDILTAWYGPSHPDLAQVRSLLARAMMLEGKDAGAEAILQDVLAIQERAYGKADRRMVATLDTLGEIDLKRGELAKAEADLTRAVDMSRTLFGPDDSNTAMVAADLGEAYRRLRQYPRAIEVLAPAVATMQRTIPPLALNTAEGEMSWGESLLALKRYPEAEKQFEAAYSIYKVRAPSSAEFKTLRTELTAVYAALHEPEKAAKL